MLSNVSIFLEDEKIKARRIGTSGSPAIKYVSMNTGIGGSSPDEPYDNKQNQNIYTHRNAVKKIKMTKDYSSSDPTVEMFKNVSQTIGKKNIPTRLQNSK